MGIDSRHCQNGMAKMAQSSNVCKQSTAPRRIHVQSKLLSPGPCIKNIFMLPARHREGREEFASEPAQAAASLKLQSPKQGRAIVPCNVNQYMYICMYNYMYICMHYTFVYIYIYVCVYIYIYIYVCMSLSNQQQGDPWWSNAWRFIKRIVPSSDLAPKKLRVKIQFHLCRFNFEVSWL